MDAPLVLVTGFGPFPGVVENPSGCAARALAAEPPEGVAVVARELPVELEAAASAFDAALAQSPRTPDLLLALGVHRGGWWRPEARARARLTARKPDNAGRIAAEMPPLGDHDLVSAWDAARVAALLARVGATDARPSEDAGGYVCERVHYAALAAGERLGVPALFLHVPPLEAVPLAQQVAVLSRLLPLLIAERPESLPPRSGRG